MRITPTGLIGIGTSAPTANMEIHSETAPADLVVSSPSNTASIWVQGGGGSLGMTVDVSGAHIRQTPGTPPAINISGEKVGIGISNMYVSNDYKLFVKDGILTEKVKVNLVANWPDYVLSPDYCLQSLSDVAEYIRIHGHLPEVPTASKMAAEGLDLAETDAMLLKKVEELTLHLIAMEERIAHLEFDNSELRNQGSK